MTTATPAAETRLLSAEVFLLLPKPADGARQELVRGGIVTMAAPGFRHGVGVGRVFSILDGFVFPRRLGRVTVESGLVTERGPDTVRGPDVAYWSAARIPLDRLPVGDPGLAADLMVEVLSPSNRPGQVREKIGEYFAAGVRIVWLVDPEDRALWVYRSADEARVLYENSTVDGGDVLPGFTRPVVDFFAI